MHLSITDASSAVNSSTVPPLQLKKKKEQKRIRTSNMMFTTELSHRVFLTVLLLLVAIDDRKMCHAARRLGFENNNDENNPATTNTNNKFKTSSSTNDDNDNNLYSIPLARPPPDDIHSKESSPSGKSRSIYYGQGGHNSRYTTDQFGTMSKPGTSYMVTSSPGGNRNSGSISGNRNSGTTGGTTSVVINTKPLSIVTTGITNENSNNDRRSSYSHYANKPTYTLKTSNCFGKKCLTGGGSNSGTRDDEWKSYYSTLNKGLGGYTNRQGHRISRTTTTTSAPGWVKLQPVFTSSLYDPFSLMHNNTQSEGVMSKPRDPTKEFSNRVGEELSPESFADRWGYNEGAGSKLPSWLEELNQSLQDIRRPAGGPMRDGPHDNRNWVKLDPIPVAGVRISKWVPKGTPTADLPTTNWPNRDRPNAWWDRIDSGSPNNFNNNNNKRPSSYPPVSADLWQHKDNWNTRYPFLKPQQQQQQQQQSNQWNDIIYPESGSSATTSWESKPGISSSYPSSFPVDSSWSSNSRPVTGSWSANNNVPSRFGNRRPSFSPTNYPDALTNKDDPRWVLVSNSRRVSVSPGSSSNKYGNSGNNNNRGQLSVSSILQNLNKYHPNLDNRYDDYQYLETGHRGHRNSKDLFKRSTTTPNSLADQDEIFRRINFTLQSLTPVLNHRNGRPPQVNDERSDLNLDDIKIEEDDEMISTSPSKVNEADIVSTSEMPRQTSEQPTVKTRTGLLAGIRKLNPVVAAVGAGLIPATMAAVVPMVLGKRRRRRNIESSELIIPVLPQSVFLVQRVDKGEKRQRYRLL